MLFLFVLISHSKSLQANSLIPKPEAAKPKDPDFHRSSFSPPISVKSQSFFLTSSKTVSQENKNSSEIELDLNSVTDHRSSKKHDKSVSFNTMLRVILIPSIIEYKDAGIHELVWNSASELNLFKQSAMIEVLEHMDQTGIDSVSAALKSLYCTESTTEAVPDCQ